MLRSVVGGHTAPVADFPDREAYLRYAQDPAHLAVIAENITPCAVSRTSVRRESEQHVPCARRAPELP